MAILIVLLILLLARPRSPESIRWLIRKGRIEEAKAQAIRYYGEAEGTLRFELAQKSADESIQSNTVAKGRMPSLGIRFYVTLTTAFAGSVGFGLITYVLGRRSSRI